MANDAYLYPSDPAVVGKRGATASYTEDGVVKQWDRFIAEDRRIRAGVYLCQTGAHVLLAAADAATVGRWYLINPVGSGVLVALRRIEFMSQLGSALLTPTSPRVQVERFTFTGTASGAIIPSAKSVTAQANPVASVRSANTGLAPTAGAPVYAFLPIACATAAAFTAPGVGDWNPDNDGMVVLTGGEGLILRQPDAGTAADTRRYITNIAWEEYTEF